MRHLTILIVAAACLFSLGAAGDAPQSKPARSALDDYSTAKSKLDADYHAKLAGLTKSLLTRLTAAKAGAMKANDLPEANAIQSEIDRVTALLDESNPVKTFTIDAAKDWQPTLEVKKGQKINIEAKGEWCYWTGGGKDGICGPDGRFRDGGKHFFLEGRIGDGKAFVVGSKYHETAEQDGTLSLRMNEVREDMSQRNDNAGSVHATISCN